MSLREHVERMMAAPEPEPMVVILPRGAGPADVAAARALVPGARVETWGGQVVAEETRHADRRRGRPEKRTVDVLAGGFGPFGGRMRFPVAPGANIRLGEIVALNEHGEAVPAREAYPGFAPSPFVQEFAGTFSNQPDVATMTIAALEATRAELLARTSSAGIPFPPGYFDQGEPMCVDWDPCPGIFGPASVSSSPAIARRVADAVRRENRKAVEAVLRDPHRGALDGFGRRRGPRWETFEQALAAILEDANAREHPAALTASSVCVALAMRVWM